MTMLFMDSCSHYTAAQSGRKYGSTNTTGLSITTSNVRHGSAIQFANNAGFLFRSITSSLELTFGFDCWPSNTLSTTGVLLSIFLGGSVQCSLCTTTGNLLQFRRGNNNDAVLGTTSSGLAISAHTYVELTVTLSTTVGTVDVWFNGVNVLSLSGINTCKSGTPNADGFRMNGDASGNGFSTWQFQDLYVLNSLGSVNNARLGDVYVEALFPNAAGHNSGWTIGGTGPAATRWQSVNDATPDDNVTYITSSLALDICDFLITSPTLTPTAIFSLQWAVCGEKTNAGPSTLEAEVSIGGLSFTPGTFALSNNYIYGLMISEVNPSTSVPWSLADLAILSFGIELAF